MKTLNPARRTLSGVLPIVHVPFDARDQIDAADLRREIDWIFSVGADGLGTGMVSEVTRLSADERPRLTDMLVEYTAGRGSVFVSVGAETATVAQAQARDAERAGCDAVMAVPPMTTRLSTEAVVAYFRGIAESMSLPLVVQDASGYVGRPMSIAFQARLLDEFGPDRVVDTPIAENTLVVFMNDNGTSIGTQEHNAQMRGGKGTAWLGGTRAN